MKPTTIEQYLEELGSRNGKPGGGSAAALVGAMSASLAQMVADIEKNKKKHADHKETFIQLLEKAQGLKEAFEQLSEKDAAAFDSAAEAYKLPKETEEEKKIRSEKIQKGLAEASEPPLETMQTVLSVLELFAELVQKEITGSIVNDIAVGLLFSRTTLEAAWLNVLVNARSMTDPDQKNELLERGKQLLEEGSQQIDTLYQASTIYLETGKWPVSLLQNGEMS